MYLCNEKEASGEYSNYIQISITVLHFAITVAFTVQVTLGRICSKFFFEFSV
jgi:hypothetical protein